MPHTLWHPETIVVGVDGSETGHRAALFAVDIARHWEARLLLVTAVRTPEGWWGIGGAPPSPEALSTALLEGQKEILDQTVASLNLDGISYEAREELGDPTSAIIRVITEAGADVLVIGRRGAGLVERMMMGSVADRLAHQSPCPVIIIP